MTQITTNIAIYGIFLCLHGIFFFFYIVFLKFILFASFSDGRCRSHCNFCHFYSLSAFLRQFIFFYFSVIFSSEPSYNYRFIFSFFPYKTGELFSLIFIIGDMSAYGCFFFFPAVFSDAFLTVFPVRFDRTF